MFEKNQEEPKVPKGRDLDLGCILHHREADGGFSGRVQGHHKRRLLTGEGLCAIAAGGHSQMK